MKQAWVYQKILDLRLPRPWDYPKVIIKSFGYLMKDLFTSRFRPALAITFKMVSGVKDENVREGRMQGSRSRRSNIWSSKEPHSQRQKKSIPYMSLVICLGSFLDAKPSHPALTTYFRAEHPSPTFPFILSTNRDGIIWYLTTQSLYFENFIYFDISYQLQSVCAKSILTSANWMVLSRKL